MNELDCPMAALLLAALVLPSALQGCASDKAANSASGSGKTVMVSYTQHQKDQLNATGNGMMSGVADSVQNFPLTGAAGEEFDDNQAAVWVEGNPLNGLKVVLQGNAFSQGVLGPPRNISAQVRDAVSNDVKSNAAVTFTTTGVNSYTATFQNLKCIGSISFDIMIPALRAGNSNYEVLVSSADASVPPVTLKRNVAISEKTESPLLAQPSGTSASAEPNLPTDATDSESVAGEPSSSSGDSATGTATSSDSSNQPQTTFDMGKEQGTNP